jgi:putative transcriptional regulator
VPSMERSTENRKYIRIHLRTILAREGISQRELARRTGLRPNTISALCTDDLEKRAGMIDFETLARICRALRVQPGDLLECELDDESTTSYET